MTSIEPRLVVVVAEDDEDEQRGYRGRDEEIRREVDSEVMQYNSGRICDRYIQYGSTLITSTRQYGIMPINIDDFAEGRLPDVPSVPEQVVRFLAANDDRAFTHSEIAAGIDADPNTVGTALS